MADISNHLIPNMLTYTGNQMTAQGFALSLQYAKNAGSKFIISGCTVTKNNTSSGNSLHVEPGWCMIKGRLVQVAAGDLVMTLPSSTTEVTRYVCIVIDLGNSSEPVYIEVRTTIPADGTTFNIETGGRAYLPLASFKVSNSGINADSITKYTINSVSSFYSDLSGCFSADFTASANNWCYPMSGNPTFYEPNGCENGIYLINYTVTVSGTTDTTGIITAKAVNYGTEIGKKQVDGRQTAPIAKSLYSTMDCSFLYYIDADYIPKLAIQLYSNVPFKCTNMCLFGIKVADTIVGF